MKALRNNFVQLLIRHGVWDSPKTQQLNILFKPRGGGGGGGGHFYIEGVGDVPLARV